MTCEKKKILFRNPLHLTDEQANKAVEDAKQVFDILKSKFFKNEPEEPNKVTRDTVKGAVIIFFNEDGLASIPTAIGYVNFQSLIEVAFLSADLHADALRRADSQTFIS